jgi:N-acetylmuramoyl-L-alanine amidase
MLAPVEKSMPRLSEPATKGLAVFAASAISLSLAVGCGASTTTTTITQSQPLAATAATTAPAQVQTRTNTTPSSPSGPTATSTPGTVAVPKPRIIWDPIPFGSERKAQMVAYVRRHYGSFMAPTYKLIDPHVIVIHYTETPSFQATYNTFAPDTPDPELHELPNTCAHFVIDKGGGIHQLVPLDIMCRHTVGLNWTAIGIEHVGYSDQEVLDNRAQMAASLRLVRWLRCRYHISIRNVIGHNESLSSPYHREDVPSLRTQTHSDFNHSDMQIYRRRLAAAAGCG